MSFMMFVGVLVGVMAPTLIAVLLDNSSGKINRVQEEILDELAMSEITVTVIPPSANVRTPRGRGFVAPTRRVSHVHGLIKL